jgi:hypothetical protein
MLQKRALDPLVVPPPPRAPSERARALVFRRQGVGFVLLLMGAIFVGVGGFIAVLFAHDFPADLAITARGRAAAGRVVSTVVDRHLRINNRHPTVITFDWDDERGRHEATSMTIDGDVVARAQPGSVVDLEVAGDRGRVRGTTISPLGLYSFFLLIIPLVGIVLVAAASTSRRRRIRAFTIGRAIVARVTKRGLDYAVRINGRHPTMVCWEFSLEGRAFKGKISSMKPELVEPLGQGDDILVLYDPDNPRINTCWVE